MPFVSFGFLAPYARRHPKKMAARHAVRAAIERGELTRAPCEVCGDEEVHAHHPDYDKPLDVLWLCPFHHFAWHRKNGHGLNGGDPMHRAGGIDLTGQRFSALTVISELPERLERASGGVLWYCMCDCGEAVARLGADLIVGSKKGHWQSCSECRRKKIRPANRWFSRAMLENHRLGYGMYSSSVVDRCESDIRAELGDQLGVTPCLDELDSLPPLVTAGFEEFMTGDGVASAPETRDGETLEALGREFGVSRERIRQIEEAALEKIRLGLQDKAQVPVIDPGVRRIRKQVGTCGHCGVKGHNRRGCPQKVAA